MKPPHRRSIYSSLGCEPSGKRARSARLRDREARPTPARSAGGRDGVATDVVRGRALADRTGVAGEVAAVIDLFSRRVVGWSMKTEMTAQLVADSLVMAIWRRGKPNALLHHSNCDRPIYQRAVRDADVRQRRQLLDEPGPATEDAASVGGDDERDVDHLRPRRDGDVVSDPEAIRRGGTESALNQVCRSRRGRVRPVRDDPFAMISRRISIIWRRCESKTARSSRIWFLPCNCGPALLQAEWSPQIL
jgi:hypothetical protein